MALKDSGISHEDISRRFLDSGFYNFEAAGKLIAEIGPQLVINDKGWHGINFGKYHILACMLTAEDLLRYRDFSATVGALKAVESLAERG